MQCYRIEGNMVHAVKDSKSNGLFVLGVMFVENGNLKGHWTSITSSPNFFQQKLRFVFHQKCWHG